MTFTTDSQLKSLIIANNKKEQYAKDGSIKNLYVMLRETSKTFIFRYKIDGSKIKSITIGQYPSISLAEARQKANEFKTLLARGIDPRDYTNEHELTFKDVAQKWLKEKAKQKLSSLKKAEGRLNNHILPKIGNIKIKDLKRDKLINCILEVELKSTRGDGYETKTRIFMILKDILKYIAIQGIIQDYTSPLAEFNFSDICKDKHIVSNHRFIKDPTRLKEFLTAIDNYKGNIYTKFALQLGTYTALRSGTIRTLKWEYIDFTQNTISIPAEQMKMKKPFILPISSQAKAILKELKAYQLGEYLFSINSKIMSENTLNKAIKILGFGDEATFHGFRGLFSTICHENTQDHGLTSEVIELCLAHEDKNKVRSAYNKSERLQEKADLMEWYGNYIDNLKKG